MSLRDYFAAKVITKVLCDYETTRAAADAAYRIADAMLRARHG
jgi:hypothetical protein